LRHVNLFMRDTKPGRGDGKLGERNGNLGPGDQKTGWRGGFPLRASDR
jgi:hypothetical protein